MGDGNHGSAVHRSALTSHRPPHGRRVRLRGPVTPGSARDNAADLLDRSATGRLRHERATDGWQRLQLWS
ncbi:hypothetical protein ACFCXR_14940 [Streptomyces noursei]|uniref:hypothetical protein n=1 Tax=Streptomyces TaxID=1883 RepID=UPI001F2A7FB3|nr:hypothetical protein [Streptomyces noursei]MCE4946533.1 hypothetical protein [Streptomyces noursei]